MSSRLQRWISKWVSGRNMLAYSLIILAFLCLYRVLNLWTTGFFVSDEYGYIQNAIHGSVVNNAAFGYRYFFAILNVELFRVLSITDVDRFIVLLPFYLFLWGALTLYFVYLISRILELEERVVAFLLFSCLFLVSFMLLSLGFLTESGGLSLVMGGILCMLRYAKHDGKRITSLGYPLLGALAFGAARYTREPYVVFLVGGVPIMVLLALNHIKRSSRSSRNTMIPPAILAILLFSVPSLYLVNNPVPIFAQAGPTAASLGTTITQPVVAVNSTRTVTSVQTVTITEAITHIETSTFVSNGETITTSFTVTQFVTITTTTTTAQVTPFTTLILKNEIVNTVWIFFAGILLGWGPVLFTVGLIGFLLLSRTVLRQKSPMNLAVLLLVLLALASYMAVSYFFSPDPTFITSQHYSTIIRFSATALPAYFLTAPFVFAAMARRKHHLAFLGIILIVFLLVAIPTYESYAASSLNLDNNPFALSYRSAGVQIRDYIMSNPSSTPYHIMSARGNGWFSNNVWFWTPGNTLLPSVNVLPPLNQSQFVQMRLSVFYIYGDSVATVKDRFPYLFNATQSNPQTTNANVGQQFVIASRQVIFDDQQGVFMKLQALWPD